MSEIIPLPPPASAPKQIGKYRILRQIAQGGMAEIFLASASGIEGFEKLCVLKRILPLLAANREFVQMFLDEARIAASLMHSNIAQVFDIGSDAGSYYFVMEFLRGEDVRHVLQSAVAKQGFIPLEHAASIVMGVCSGLHYAHEMHGKDGRRLHLVHRDISPQNVFVTHDGAVKLCDFGIAKSAAQLTETRVGTLKGKIRYMSPEQCRSEPLDRRSDVFALSIVLWELLTLRRLFTGKSDFEIFKAIVEEPMPTPSALRSDVPPQLDAIVMKGLSREREDRFQTAQELQLALEEWVRHDRVPASSVRLAGYMHELFGPPPPVESFLGKASESDPLALRIRALNNENVESDSAIRAPTVSMRAAPLESSPDDASRQLPRPPGLDSPPSDDDLAAELEPSVGLARPAPKAMVLLAVAVCASAVAVLLSRGPSLQGAQPAPSPTPPAPSAAMTARPAAAQAADGLRAPQAPLVEPQRAAVSAPTAVPPPRPAVSKPASLRPPPRARSTRPAEPAKKPGVLDELLPP